MIRCLVFMMILIALALLVAGCGDDDCPDCPTLESSPPLYAVGTMAVPEANWFSVKMLAYPLSGSSYEWTYACVDTNFVSMALPYGSDFTREVDLYIASASGPMPTETNPVQNISGDLIAGTIYSLSSETNWDINLIRALRSIPDLDLAVEVPSLADLIRADGTIRPTEGTP